VIDAAKSFSRDITPVIPYFGYARQDRKDKPRCQLDETSSKLLETLLEQLNYDHGFT
jgi:ribose-phosphate pyrophosphokinase